MTPTAEPLPSCRRKALMMLALGALGLAGAGAGYAWWALPSYALGFLVGVGLAGLGAGAMLWFSPDMSDAVPKAAARRYQREVGFAMAGYVLIMLKWKQLLGAVDATWLRVVIALVPVLLVGWVLRAFVRYVGDSDELHRRIELESGSIAGLLVSATYLAAGFLQSADLIAVPAKVAMLWVFPSLCLFYAVTKVVVARRYL
jgi:hypothetical protein